MACWEKLKEVKQQAFLNVSAIWSPCTALCWARTPPAAAETATRGAQATRGRRSSRRLAAWICGASPAAGRKIMNLIGTAELQRGGSKSQAERGRGADMVLGSLELYTRARSSKLQCLRTEWHHRQQYADTYELCCDGSSVASV